MKVLSFFLHVFFYRKVLCDHLQMYSNAYDSCPYAFSMVMNWICYFKGQMLVKERVTSPVTSAQHDSQVPGKWRIISRFPSFLQYLIKCNGLLFLRTCFYIYIVFRTKHSLFLLSMNARHSHLGVFFNQLQQTVTVTTVYTCCSQ